MVTVEHCERIEKRARDLLYTPIIMENGHEPEVRKIRSQLLRLMGLTAQVSASVRDGWDGTDGWNKVSALVKHIAEDCTEFITRRG